MNSPHLTVRRCLVLLLAFALLCTAGGLVLSGLYMPLAFGINSVTNSSLVPQGTQSVDMELSKLPQQSKMYARDGKTLIATFYDQNRVVVALKDIAEPMQKAVVAREDHRFLEHTGIDPQGIARAFVQTYVRHGATQGGSTLTQQYVKNALMDQAIEANDPIAEYHAHEETVARKLREMLISIQLERHHSKEEILQGYLNIAQFGVGTYGVEAAARRYFSKSAKDLTLGESATIAAVTKNPAAYDPTRDAKESEHQRNIVLSQMQRYGFASAKDVAAAKKISVAASLHVSNTPVGCESAGNAAYFCDYVMRVMLNSDQFGKTAEERRRLLYQGGLKIVTTLDKQAQDDSYAQIVKYDPVNDRSGIETMLTAVKPGTGEILAMAQNRNYSTTTNNGTSTSINYNVDQRWGGGSGFAIGSSFKIINLVAWMQAGRKISIPMANPTVYPIDSFPCATKTHQIWNLHDTTGGAAFESPLQGLVMSHNTTQASMAQKIGLCKIADAATALGYQNAIAGQQDIHDTMTPTMVIGTLNTSPLSMANVYATVGANGVHCNPIALRSITDSAGKTVKVPSANCTQAIPKDIAQTAAYALNQAVTRGVAQPARLPNYKSFAKTGTNEQTSMSVGSFLPNEISVFTLTGNAEYPRDMTGMTIGGHTEAYWYGESLSAPLARDFLEQYATQKHLPNNTSYGTPSPRYN